MAILRKPDWTFCLDDPVGSVSWSPRKDALVVATVSGPIVIMESLAPTVRLRMEGHTGGTFRAAWSPQGDCIASGGQDGHAKIWNSSNGQLTESIPMGNAWVEQLAWSPDGHWLAIGAGKRLKLWERGNGRESCVVEHRSTISGLAWSKDSKKLATSCYGGIQLWDPATGQSTSELVWKTSLVSVAWSPDQRWVVAGTQELSVQIWELPFKPGEELAMSGYKAKVRELAWHSKSRFLATGGGSEIMVWDCGSNGPQGREPRILEGHSELISALAYQNKGHVLASGGRDQRVILWNAGKSQTLCEMEFLGSITELAWASDDSKLAVATHDGVVGVATVS